MSTNKVNIQKNIELLREDLLDLTLRNKLLNFKPQSKSIAIHNKDIAELYDILVLNEKTMKFLSKDSLDEEYLLDSSKWNSNSEAKDSHLYNYLQTNYERDSLKKKLSAVYRENKIMVEEQGYNSFYLALGFLEWKDTKHQENTSKAPLILVPLNIKKDSRNSPFTVNWNGEEIRSNLSLIFKLQEQDIDLPDFEEFHSKEDLKNYLNDVKKAIMFQPQWNVTTDIYLSNFSFKKFVMFKDLDLNQWNMNSTNVNRIFEPGLDKNYDDYEFDEEDIASIKSSEIFNVMDADSSQLAVLEEIKKDKNLVVEGPPGTGKSQTIVNIIAELLAKDKKILFVSEKKAALDVVKSRLDHIGVGEGCLELHGKNSNKKSVLEELRKTLNLDHTALPNENDFEDLDSLKEELNEYINTLHTVYKKTELNVYELIGFLEKNTQILENNNQKIYNLNIKDVSNLNPDKRGEYKRKLDEIITYYNQIKPIVSNVWVNTNPLNMSSPQKREVEEELSYLIKDIEKYNNLNNDTSELIGTNKLDTFEITSLINNSKILKPKLKLLKNSDNLEELVSNITQFQNKSKNINLDVLDLDLDSLKEEIDNIMNNISSLNLSLDIVENEDFKTISDNFKLNKHYIEESNLEKVLEVPDLENKFYKFKKVKDSFLKKIINSEFKNTRKEFKKYYPIEISENISDDQIVEDFEKLIDANKELSKLRNKILSYTNQTTSDEKILIESEKLIEWANDLDKIKSKLNNFKVTTNNSILKEKIKNLIELRELLSKIEKSDEIGQYYFNDLWESYKSDINKLNTELENIKNFKKLYDEGFFSDKTLKFIENEEFDKLSSKLNEFSDTKDKIQLSYNQINNILNFKNDLYFKDLTSINVIKFRAIMNNLLESIDDLNNYRLFIKYCEDYNDNYLNELINLIKEDKIKSENIINLFYYNFANIALKDVFESNSVLDEFNYKFHEDKIAQFKELDSKIMVSNQIRIKEILSLKRPNINRPSGDSSLGILLREMNKKRRIKPIRKLLTETHDVISSIKPCFMMSPISIAQYLNPKVFENYFDYVIFDEASQIKVADAIGAMLRGKHYIIMGDTKQLPPTNFFNVESNVDEDEEDNEENYAKDLESILHLCKNNFDNKMLRWHYRSLHESLISVSNFEFYNNKLYVFPSPMKNSESLGLKFKYRPNTIYLRGKGQSYNQKEAEAVIDYAFECVRKYGRNKSIGIGTFSAKQSKIIEDVLDTKLRDNPELEQYFVESGKDGFFIKNLENIQGDERDIILISIGYGKDQDGKFSLNFGPLNKEGGERRLNVLITRAKEQCIVFSNFKSSEMHTTEKTPRGVEALKTFLYYAETGEFPTNYHTSEDFDSPFEESVYDFLTDEGYLVETQVGCANYKIDLAIVDKDNANRYILGIECDGATYHSSKLARDRDRLRQQVLENLGWKFHRIWSTDWYHNRTQAKKRLLEAVEDAIKNKDNVEIVKKVESNFEPEVITKSKEELLEEELDKYFENYSYFTPYGINHLEKSMLVSLINQESPVHIEDIYDRLKTSFCKKATSKFKRDVNNALRDLIYNSSIIKKGNFYYAIGFNEDNLKVRKRKSPKAERIPIEEIQKAIITTLKLQFSSKRDDLIKESSKYLGFTTLRVKNREFLNNALNQMIYSRIIKEENNVITLSSNKQ